jgi:dihydrofolate reductase
MRKLILSLAVSLDGFIEGPNGEYDWCVPDPGHDLSGFFKRVDSLFVGRKTYIMSQEMGGGPPGFPKFKEYIFSTTLEKVKKGATLIKHHVKTEVEKIKREPGKDIWLFGGAGLTASLLNAGLIDEIILAVYPVLLGGGKRLFSDIKQKINLSLTDSKVFSTGLISLTYDLTKKE